MNKELKKVKKNKGKILLIALLLITGAAYFNYIHISGISSEPMMQVSGYYDLEGNKITPGLFTIVNGVDKIGWIELSLKVVNTGTSPMLLKLDTYGAAPPSFEAAISSFDGKGYYLQPGESKVFLSEQIDVRSARGSITYSVDVIGEKLTETLASTGVKQTVRPTLTLNFEADPTTFAFTADFTGWVGMNLP